MITRTREEWRSIRQQIADFEHSLLWEAINEEFTKARASLAIALDDVKNPINELNYAQGGRFHLFRAIMVLGSLSKAADRALKKPTPRGDDDA